MIQPKYLYWYCSTFLEISVPAIDTTDMKLQTSASLHQAKKITDSWKKNKEPNKETLEAMVELDDGEGEIHESISSLVASLNADD